MEFVPYNAFQKIMRLWDEVHPYNAAQLMKLEGAPDFDRLNTHWRQTLSTLGVGRVIMNGAKYAHGPWNGEPGHQFIRVEQPTCSLEEHLTFEMNRRYDGPEYCPFRAFVVSEAGAHYLGVIYHHWVADSGSIRALLREWFLSMYDPARCRTTPLHVPAEGYWHFFGPRRFHWGLQDAVLALLRHTTRFGRARQSPISDHDDFSVKVSIHSLPDGLADTLLASARRAGVTVNDVFLAAMAETCHYLGANELTHDRDELALGTIVDLRMLADQNMDDLFGLFLGFTNTIVRQQDLTEWPRLLTRISSQTSFQKKSGASQASVVRMIGALLQSHFLPARKWVDLYRRQMPMAAGISNINMNRQWLKEYCPSPIIEYIRIAPPSALLPMTFGTTTTGNKLNVALTRQISYVDDERAARIMESFTRRLLSV